MRRFSFEQSRASYLADFWFYGLATSALALSLWRSHIPGSGLSMSALVLTGFALWSLMEYLLHRFVLHGLQPFAYWHALHHARANALIGAPTWASAALFALLISLPSGLLLGWRVSGALSFGVLSGYLLYITTHHAIHHWTSSGRWLSERKRIHALHHRPKGVGTHFGVTFSIWDRVFRSVPATLTSQ